MGIRGDEDVESLGVDVIEGWRVGLDWRQKNLLYTIAAVISHRCQPRADHGDAVLAVTDGKMRRTRTITPTTVKAATPIASHAFTGGSLRFCVTLPVTAMAFYNFISDG
jgi:hypothetical protein